MQVTTHEDGEDVIRKYGPNELITILPNIPHLFEAIKDTTMIEYWEKKFEAKYYKPYRDIIDASMKENNS